MPGAAAYNARKNAGLQQRVSLLSISNLDLQEN
jgi:hypothetical protein